MHEAPRTVRIDARDLLSTAAFEDYFGSAETDVARIGRLTRTTNVASGRRCGLGERSRQYRHDGNKVEVFHRDERGAMAQ